MAVAMQYGSGIYRGKRTDSGITMTLLWTNPDPTSNFAAQTVSLDLAEYNAVLITYTAQANSTRFGSAIGLIDGNNYFVTIGIDSTANNYIYKRGAAADNSGVTFTTGYRDTTSSTGYAIPLYIYGIG